jgi:hypothetical protein
MIDAVAGELPDEDPPEEVRAWDWREHHLLILPGVSWEEWNMIWNTCDQTSKSWQFWVGDCLLTGQREFGEQFSQVLDAKYAEQHKVPLWVCSKIEPSRRRPNVSFSAHKVIAGIDDVAEQDRWLKRADDNLWTVRELQEAIDAEGAKTKRREKIRAGSNMGPPLEDERDPTNPFAPLERSGNKRLELANSEFSTQARDILAALRSLGTDNRAYTETGVDILIADALQEPLWPFTADVNRAIRLIPADWQTAITYDIRAGTLQWTVDARQPETDFAPERIAIGLGPNLAVAICEAAITARLTDTGEC